MRILVIEDDPTVGQYVKRGLEEQRWSVDLVTDGEEGERRAGSEAYDLVVLDMRLPGKSGLELLHTLRARGFERPVLVLTAQDAVDAKVTALRAGADDYVTKPFRLAELLARVRALLRRGTAEGSAAHGVRIDPDARRAWHGDTELDLTTKEFDLLWILLRDAGKVVTREQIMREVWDAKWWTSTKTLDMHISWLRRKLGDDAHSPRYITTVRGVGFRFERGD
jgi:DNA-binding response OmpR family regulator